MKHTGLEPGDLLASPEGDSVIRIESEDDGNVVFRVRAPGETFHRFSCSAHDLIGWQHITQPIFPGARASREATEDRAIAVTGSPATIAEKLDGYFGSGWTFGGVIKAGDPSERVIVLRRRVWTLR